MNMRQISYVPVVLSTSLLSVAARGALPFEGGLVLHLDASVLASGSVSLWPDASGLDHSVRQADTTKRPEAVLKALNGKPVVRFSGEAYLDGPPVVAAGQKTFTMAAVWCRTHRHGAQVICEQAADGVGRRASLLSVNAGYGFNGQNNDQHNLVTYAPGLFSISLLTLDEKGNVTLWHNDARGAQAAGGAISAEIQNTGADRFRIGAKISNDGECLEGDVAEVLVFDRVLGREELESLSRYLGEKWGVAMVGDGRDRQVRELPTEVFGAVGADGRRNFASRVPAYRFADTLEEQEAQLADNPLLARFRHSRALFAEDRYRPLYHYVSPESTMNDPNGLCFRQGRWHLFYQAYPPEDGRQHWGHAVSEDLIHWRDLPYAIYPDPEEKCFSGTTLVEGDRVIAIYHGTLAGTMVAVSSDPLLLNWEKVTGAPVIPFPKPGEPRPPYTIFDPCIWRQGDVYYALTAGTLPDGPGGKAIRAEFLHLSNDLSTWEYLHPFVENDYYGLVGDDGACPYFWPIADRHMLLHFSHMSGGKYLIGDYDTERDKFVVTAGGDFNFGPAAPAGVHAPSAAPDGDGNVIVIFNMNPGKPTRGWNQVMTLPRKLSLAAGDQLLVEPAGEVERLRRRHQRFADVPLPANREVVLDRVQGNALELQAEIETGGSPMVELNVLRSPDREEVTRIAFYRDRGFRPRWGGPHDSLITIDSSYSSTLPDVRSRAPETAPVRLVQDEALELRVFIDRSIVEVFVNGRQCVALRVYPGRADSVGVSLRSQGRAARLVALDAWEMSSIW